MDRTILHSDINSCYASIERLYDPTLVGKPIAVCGDAELRHGIILSKDELAKAAGVKTGEAIWQAKQKCPELIPVAAHYDRYVKYSHLLRQIYGEYTDLCEPYGLDECWLDITGCVACPDGERTAHEIRERVRRETGLTVSVGVSWNKILAKLGSDYKKPDAVTVIGRDNFRDLVWPLPASDLLMVGRSTAATLRRLGIRTIGDLAMTDEMILRSRLGKAGSMLHAYANGLDGSRVRRFDEREPPKSIGNSTTTPHDIGSFEAARPVLLLLAESVGARLRGEGFRCRTVEISLRTTDLEWSSHRLRLRDATDVTQELYEYGQQLLRESHEFPTPLRSMGLRALELVNADADEQIDIFMDYVNKEKQQRLDAAMDNIRRKYGNASIQRAAVFGATPENFGFCTLPGGV